MYHNIYQNCQPFLQEINNEPSKHTMHRGIPRLEHSEENPHYDIMGIKDVRLSNRLPKDTIQKDHDEINDYLNQVYGHPYRNGLFVTGIKSVAEGYGTAFAIFPIGKFDYIWHPEITDLYTEFLEPENVGEHWEDYAASMGKDLPEVDDWYAFQENYGVTDLMDFVFDGKKGHYKSNELIRGINRARTEIMIWVDQYYYLHPTYVRALETWLSK